ncbi:MAG TPA: C25 family cysteine peptidase [Anaerolineae bacterium]|nr:C25 family cysteine peptidase [Anaerolineae bacterium]
MPLTCTDANDVLHAGDVIVPYNAVPVTTWYAYDQFGTVAYNNNNGNLNWATNWIEAGDDGQPYYRDEFASSAYNLSVGTLDWGYSWTEANDDGSASTGRIMITGGELRFGRSSGSTAVGVAISRTANLSGYTAATLTYSYREAANEAADAVQVRVRNPPGGWVTLATITGLSNTGTMTHDISPYIDADTEIQFYTSAALESGEYIYFDNVNIALSPGTVPTGPAAGNIYITGGQLRFVAAPAGASIERGVALPGSVPVQLTFDLGQNGIDANEDRMRLEVSPDGGTNWTTLETYTSSGSAGTKSYDITAYATADTRIRFYLVDALESGEYWSIDNIRVQYGPLRDPAQILFDARDKIGASKGIAITRATWASGSGTLNAFAHEMYATTEWGTVYESPLGTNTISQGPSGYGMFEYSGLSIMAAHDNTTVQVDKDANGSYETTVVLDEGEATLVSGILQGARVMSDKAVQVVLVTGDIGSNYGSRDMTLLPLDIWGSSYWSPVGNSGYTSGNYTSGPTVLYLYNPSTNGNIYITCERYLSPTITMGPVAPRGVLTTTLRTINGVDQGAHCFASTSGGVATADRIFAVGTVDSSINSGASDGRTWDWSFTLYPDSFLTTDALTLLGLGKDPTDTSSTQNGSPLWATVTCRTYMYVDWNNDGVADKVDLNGDGDTLDTVDGINENTSDQGMLVNPLQSVRLYRPVRDVSPFDQTGARVWTRTASGAGYGGTPGCKLAVAWGEDPRTASPGSPGLDVGTSVPPYRLVEGLKKLGLKVDADKDGQLSPGDTATYTITVHNTGPTDVENVHVWDQVPPNATYVLNSTQKDVGAGWVSVPDDGSGTPYPLDADPSGILLGTLTSGSVFRVRFDVVLHTSPTFGDLLNCDVAATGGGRMENCAADLVASFDWGDLPDSYGTSAGTDGPRHTPSSLKLGSLWDAEPQGRPTAAANGDDLARSPNDEDGVRLAGTAKQWQNGTGTFTVTVSGGPGYLSVWMDFTDDAGTKPSSAAADGNFRQTGGYDTAVVNGHTYSEYIVQNVPVSTGVNVITFDVPPGLINSDLSNQFYVRFRLQPTNATIAPTGLVQGGEVEDYRFDLDDLPTRVVLSEFDATEQGGQVVVSWETVLEDGTAGFFLYRQVGEDQWVRVNDEIVPAFLDSTRGGRYWLPDSGADPGATAVYRLEEICAGGEANLYGPFEVTPVAQGEASLQSVIGPEGYGRGQHELTLPLQPPEPEPNQGSDVPEALPEWEDEDRPVPVLRPTVPAVQEEGASEEARSDASASAAAAVAAKLTVREPGLYFVEVGDIARALGITSSAALNQIRSGGLKLSNQGKPVAYLAASGYVGFYFYGEAINSLYTRDNVYWLERVKGSTVASYAAKVPAAVEMGTFLTTVHAERDLMPAPAVATSATSDIWMWQAIVAGNPALGKGLFEVPADGAAGGLASLKAQFVSLTDAGTGRDHHVQILVNGTLVGEARWTGKGEYQASRSFDASLLVDGVNTVEVIGLRDAGVPYSIFLVNWFDLTYPRYYRATDNVLAFTSANAQAATVYGFTDRNVMVFDLSDPRLPKAVSNVKIEASGGAFRATFKPSAAGVPYLATTTGAVKRITTLAADTPSNLSAKNAANYIVITNGALKPAAEALAAYRAGQGLKTMVVDVQDIYDEFNFGVASPQAIDSFLTHAYQKWSPKPSYVLLAGAGSYDYKNNLGAGDCIVPPQMVMALGSLVAADGTYADVVGDAAPELAVGRLPVVTAEELSAYTAKIQAYEAADPSGWSRQVLLLADNPDAQAGDFTADSELLAGAVPGGYNVLKYYLGPQTAAQVRTQTLAALTAGVGVFNYVGHGGLDSLAAEKLLKSADVPTLANSPRLPLMSAATCVVGDYATPAYRTLGVLMALQGNGGAAAVFAPTGESFDADAVPLDLKLFQNLFGGPGARVGDATRAALSQYAADGGAVYALQTYNLLGDPAALMRWR